MTTRVTLISPARSESSERYRFDDGRAGLSPAGERDARAAGGAGALVQGGAAGVLEQGGGTGGFGQGAALVVVSPSVRCVRTAEALGIGDAAERADERLAGCATGRWRGRTLDEVAAEEPEAVARWLADPEAAPHGGESVARLCTRIAEWLDGIAREPAGPGAAGPGPAGHASRRVVAVAEPDVVRAAVLCALCAPAAGLWRVDVAPLTATELTGRAGRWNLRVGLPIAGRPVT